MIKLSNILGLKIFLYSTDNDIASAKKNSEIMIYKAGFLLIK